MDLKLFYDTYRQTTFKIKTSFTIKSLNIALIKTELMVRS